MENRYYIFELELGNISVEGISSWVPKAIHAFLGPRQIALPKNLKFIDSHNDLAIIHTVAGAKLFYGNYVFIYDADTASIKTHKLHTMEV